MVRRRRLLNMARYNNYLYDLFFSLNKRKLAGNVDGNELTADLSKGNKVDMTNSKLNASMVSQGTSENKAHQDPQ